MNSRATSSLKNKMSMTKEKEEILTGLRFESVSGDLEFHTWDKKKRFFIPQDIKNISSLSAFFHMVKCPLFSWFLM